VSVVGYRLSLQKYAVKKIYFSERIPWCFSVRFVILEREKFFLR
jgi:hypothetical protein